MYAALTEVDVGLPGTGIDWLVPVIVTGPASPRDVLPDPTSVTESVAPEQVAGIEVTVRAVTTFSTTVHDSRVPLSDPQELTAAVAPTTFVEFGFELAATAPLGTASTVAVTIARAGLTRMAANR